MSKFVALRRVSPHEQPKAPRPVAEQRLAAGQGEANHEKRELLQSIGLTPVNPVLRMPHLRHTFTPLDYLKAYVVETPNPAVAERARELLEPDYIVVPNLALSLPRPTIDQRYRSRPRSYVGWPQESGIGAAHRQKIEGEGVWVGVLDTGCDADHLELRDKRIDFRYIPLDPTVDAMRTCRGFDVDGHGTHVCGIIAGRYVGVAPRVELMVASVIESETLRTSLERVVIALNAMLAELQLEKNLNKPAILNISLGFLPEWVSLAQIGAVSRGIEQILHTLTMDYNVLPIVAVGNDGPGRIRAPAYFPDVLSVGAVDRTLTVAPFSGGGSSPVAPVIEPDLVGYGVDILSSLERQVEGRSIYALASGTSMAAPYVTGIAALVASADPTLQGERLRQHLLTHALPLADEQRVGAGLARFVAPSVGA
ncbi:MAG: S8 family serine peptidase [Caldilineaceae bacterium]